MLSAHLVLTANPLFRDGAVESADGDGADGTGSGSGSATMDRVQAQRADGGDALNSEQLHLDDVAVVVGGGRR